MTTTTQPRLRSVVRFVFWTVVVLVPVAATVLAAAWAGGTTTPVLPEDYPKVTVARWTEPETEKAA